MPEDTSVWYYKLGGKSSLVDLNNSLDVMTVELKSKISLTINKAECHLSQLIDCIKSIQEDGPLDMSIVESVKQLNLLIKKAEVDHSQLDKLGILEDYRSKLTDAHEVLVLFSNWDDFVSKILELLNVDGTDNSALSDGEINEPSPIIEYDFDNLLPLSKLMSNIAQGYKKARKFVSKQILSNIATIYQGYYTLFLTRLAMYVERVLEEVILPLDADQFSSLYFGEMDEFGKELGFSNPPLLLMKSHIFKTFKRIFHEYLSGLLSSLSEDAEFSHISTLDGYKKASFVIKVFVNFILTYIEERQSVIEIMIHPSQINLDIVNSGLSELSILYLMLQSSISVPKESIEELLITYSDTTFEIVKKLSLSYSDLSPFLPETVFTKYIEMLDYEVDKMINIESLELEPITFQVHSYSKLLDSLNKYTFLCIKLCECNQDDQYIKFSEFDVMIPKLASNLFKNKLHRSFVIASNRYFSKLKENEYEKYYSTLECVEYLVLLNRVKEHLQKTLSCILTFDESTFEFLSKHYSNDHDKLNIFQKGKNKMSVDSLDDLINRVPDYILSHSINSISNNLKGYSTLVVFRTGETNGLPTSLISLAGESFISLVPPFTNVTSLSLPQLLYDQIVRVLIDKAKKINDLSKSGASQLLIDLKYLEQTGSAFGLQNSDLNTFIDNVEAILTKHKSDDLWLNRIASNW